MRADSFEHQNHSNRITMATPKINLEYLKVEPTEYIPSEEFLLSLKFPYVTEEYVKGIKDEIGHYLYFFKLTYTQGDICESPSHRSSVKPLEWVIRRRISDFQRLEKSIRHATFSGIFKSKEIMKEQIDSQPKQLSYFNTYLDSKSNLLRSVETRLNPPPSLLRFLELSYVKYGSQTKYKECFLKKKAGGRYGESKCARCGTLWGKWDNRLFIISSDAVMYAKGPDENTSQIREVMNFDFNFNVYHGVAQTGYATNIILSNSTRKLVVNAPNLGVYFDFLYALKMAQENSPYTKVNRFDSFAPIRQGQASWYVDAEHYYTDVCKAIWSAKSTVYITDWWLSPELYLIRPVNTDETTMKNRETRLDLVLKSVADRGVQVMIIQYLEPTLALNNDSLYTKQTLEKMSPNIRVQRHPSQIIPVLWSHHEKMVVIDQRIGFLGGLDLCYGRMDSNEHKLFDFVQEESKIDEWWPGIDYSNSRTKDFTNVRQHWVSNLNKRKQARMPWHDIAMQVVGEPVIDLARHFIQYWNFACIDMDFKKRTQITMLQAPNQVEGTNQKIETSYFEKLKQKTKEQNEDEYHLMQEEQKKDNSDFIGNDFQKGHFNAYLKKLEQEVTEEQQIPKLTQEKQIEIELNLDVKKDHSLDEDLIEQKDTSKIENNQMKKSKFMRRLSNVVKPTKKKDESGGLSKEYIQIMKKLQVQSDSNESFYYPRSDKITHQTSYLVQELMQQQENIMMIQDTSMRNSGVIGSQQCQMVRSASSWSIGCKDVNKELSIQLAYIQLIGEAKYFIYIENQFFISNSAGHPVENGIAEAIVKRIKTAARNKEKFKIVVFVPLLPGFEGEIDDANSAVMKVQLHWEYFTISRGGNSILEQLKADPFINDPSEYIEFFSLRQHAISPETKTPVTELIYIHSKLIIVDDEIVLMGSANINDRSLLGKRDSEIAMVIEDEQKMEINMNGETLQRGKFSHTLRTALYMEHFNLPYDDVQDPLNDQLNLKIRKQCEMNTSIYREIFACYPDDNVLSISELDKFRKGRDINKYEFLNNQIKGHAVQFPLNFLKNENLKIGIFRKEALCPDVNFT